jgi:hypothetical protein
VIPLSAHNTMEVYYQITLLMLYYISSRLVNLLKVVAAPVQVSDILIIIVCFKFINLTFRILPLLFLQMFTKGTQIFQKYRSHLQF